MSNWITRGITKHAKQFSSRAYNGFKGFGDFLTDPITLASIGSGFTGGLSDSDSGFGLHSLINPFFGAFGGLLTAEAARNQRDYARDQDSKNREFAEKQFNESVRQFDIGQSNYENATQIRASDMQKVGLNPLSLGGSAQGQAASSVAGSNVASNAQQMDYLSSVIQAVLGSQANKNESERIKSEERIAHAQIASNERIASGNNATSISTAELSAENQKAIAELNDRMNRELAQKSNETSKQIAQLRADTDIALGQLKAATENYNQGENRKLQKELYDAEADLRRAFKQIDIQDNIAARQIDAALAKMKNESDLFATSVDAYESLLASNTELLIAQRNLEWQWKKLQSEQDHDRRQDMLKMFNQNTQDYFNNLHEDFRSVATALIFGLARRR